MEAKNITSHPFGKLASAGLPANISHFCCMLTGMRPPSLLRYFLWLYSSSHPLLPPQQGLTDLWRTLRGRLCDYRGNKSEHASANQSRSRGVRSIITAAHKYQHLCCSNRFRQTLQPSDAQPNHPPPQRLQRVTKTTATQASHNSTLCCYIFVIIICRALKRLQTLAALWFVLMPVPMMLFMHL